MQQITKTEMDLLIEHGLLRQVKGQYPDLTIVNKKQHKGYKQRYCTDPVYWSLQSLKKKLQKQQTQKVENS